MRGRTFRWKGEYTGDMNQAHTLETQLNVFESFVPKIPAAYLDSPIPLSWQYRSGLAA